MWEGDAAPLTPARADRPHGTRRDARGADLVRSRERRRTTQESA